MKVTLLHHTPLEISTKAIRTCWNSHDKSDSGIYKCYKCNHTKTRAEIEDLVLGTHGLKEINVMDCDKCDGEYEYIENGKKDLELMDRVGNKFKHSSTLEHISYNFYIEGISRALLQEISRHRITSLSVKSTRYTLKELKDEEPFVSFDPNKQIQFVQPEDVVRADKYIVFTEDHDVDLYSIMALENLRQALKGGISNDKAKYCLPESYKTELTWTINMRSLQNFLYLRLDRSALWEIQELAQEIALALPKDHKFMFWGIIEERATIHFQNKYREKMEEE